nr:immunoglobulin heavy chain junction region [Mus musculus]MBK4187197.1 immunoglobulin heavy chain junction region [Mus musculus]MBK4187198.1 immunoglobulin heavy chain junction region [Mus musculus]MBK4187199.1 immunoglobulin heavy chain junction region [Mus musculus]MBK4187200.1 immunoglobulin heavy chain junction region [Mus musculus]
CAREGTYSGSSPVYFDYW